MQVLNRSHGGTLLTSLLSMACPDCFLLTQDHLPRAKEAPYGLSLPKSVINQENAYRLSHRQSDGDIFSVTHEEISLVHILRF